MAVVDSGSPITVADPALLTEAGLDLETTVPVMEVPLGLGGRFARIPMFEVDLELVPPDEVDAPPLRWTSLVGARDGWRLPFTLLLGQRGWFDRFPTTINGTETTVQVTA